MWPAKFLWKKTHVTGINLYSGKNSAKCLRPGVKWNSDHSCSKDYLCNQLYEIYRNEVKCEKHVLMWLSLKGKTEQRSFVTFQKKC